MALTTRSRAELRSLGWALSARRSFSFHLLVASPGLTFGEVLDAVHGVAEGRTMVTLRPESAPLFRASAPGTLDTLVREQSTELTGDRVCLIDATEADVDEGERWAGYFLLFNARRDSLARRLEGALVLVLRPLLEPLFARAASDLWSVRTTRAVLDADPSPSSRRQDWLSGLFARPPIERTLRPVQELLWSLGDPSSFSGRRSTALPPRDLAAIRADHQGRPSPSFHDLAGLLDELEALWFQRELNNLELAELAVEIARRWERQSGQSIEAVFVLVQWATYLGDARMHVGRMEEARAAYEEADRDLDALVARASPPPSCAQERWRYDDQRAVVKNRRADIETRMDQAHRALPFAEEALRLRLSAHALAGVPTTAAALLRSYLRVGDILERSGRIDAAVVRFEAAARLSIVSGFDSDPRTARYKLFVNAHLRLAAARVRADSCGEAEAALARVRDALDAASRSDEAAWASERGVAWLLTALVRVAGDGAAAAAFARRARGALQTALDQRPNDLHVRRAITHCEALLAGSG